MLWHEALNYLSLYVDSLIPNSVGFKKFEFSRLKKWSFQEVMMNTFKTRDKLLGHVMGKLVVSNLDNEIIEQKLLLGSITSLMRDLSDDFYEKARTMPIDRFWKEFLKPNWALLHQEISADEETNQFVDILASFYFHTTKLNTA